MKSLINKLFKNKCFQWSIIIISYLFLDIVIIKSTYFYSIKNVAPMLFSLSIIMINILIIKLMSKKWAMIYYIISSIFNYILALVQYFHFKILGNFFTFSEIFLSKEGVAYFNVILENINFKIILVSVIYILLFILSIIILYKMPKEKLKLKKILIIICLSILLQFLGISSLLIFNNGYDYKSNYSPIYNYTHIEAPYRSIQVLGTIQYNIQDIFYYFYKIIYDKMTIPKNYQTLNEYFATIPDYEENNEYTNLFKDKNLIYILLESGDDWLITKEYMPTLYKMSQEGWNFTNRYAPFFYGGYTFNAEFAANTGIYLTDSFENSIDNYYPYSLPNLFKKAGYTVNSFHMNDAKYYERGTYHKTFGYTKYYGGYNTKKYIKQGYDYVDDSNWILNDETYNLLVPKNKKFMSFLITYSMHLPYFNNSLCDQAIRNGEISYEPWEQREEICLHYLSTKSDLMFKELLDRLKKDKLLDDTVIVVFADHNTYGFSDKEYLSEVKGTDYLYLQQKTPLIIWSKDIKHKDIDVLMDTADLVPTLANLFGLEFDSHNYLSTDVFSSYHDNYVYFQYGFQLNSDGTFVDSSKNSKGQEMITYNQYILKTDYYRKSEMND